MTASKHREVACAILSDLHGRFLLQRRDNVPNILYPGKIGLFGGHREGEETFLDCVIREVHEETGYLAPPEHFEHLGSYVGPDAEVPGATVAGEYYLLRGVSAGGLVVTEGSLMVVEPCKMLAIASEFAPSATAAFAMLLGKQQRA
jgi:8-oxo-dGTP diphosphatase